MTLSYTAVTSVRSSWSRSWCSPGWGWCCRNVLRHSDTLPLAMEGSSLQQAAPILRPHLAQTPPDAGPCARVLSLFDTAECATPARGGVQLSLPIRRTRLAAGHRRRGALLASSGTRFAGAAGQPLVRCSPRRGARPRRALDSRPLEERYRIDDEGMVLLTPVADEAGERVLGAVGLVLPLPPLDLGIVRQVVPLVAASLVAFTLLAAVAGTLFGYLTSRGLVRRLGALSVAAGAWSRGDFTVLVRDRSGDEIAELAQRLNRMAEQLENLLESRNRLAVLEERNRLARDLHDSAKQQAFAAAAQVGAARPGGDSAPPRAPAEAEDLSPCARALGPDR